MLRIRLRRVGKRGHPSYRVVVARQESPRDGAFLETLGAYDPHTNPPSITLNEDRAREWMVKGAQPSEAAAKILRRAGVITGEAPQRPQQPSKTETTAATATADPPAAEEPAPEEPAAADETEEATEESES